MLGKPSALLACLTRELFGHFSHRPSDLPFCMCLAPSFAELAEDLAEAVDVAEHEDEIEVACLCEWHELECPVFLDCCASLVEAYTDALADQEFEGGGIAELESPEPLVIAQPKRRCTIFCLSILDPEAPCYCPWKR